MKPRNVELRIDELVLHGFEPGERHRIGAAVERELARLFVERNAPLSLTQDGETAHLDGGSFEVGLDARGEDIGAQVARAVYGGLGA